MLKSQTNKSYIFSNGFLTTLYFPILQNPKDGKPSLQESFKLPRLNTLSKHQDVIAVRSKGAKGNLLNDILEEEAHWKVMSVVFLKSLFAH